MKVLIIEDEQLAAEKLSKTLSEVKGEAEILAILNSVDSSIEWLNENHLQHENGSLVIYKIYWR